MSRFEKKCFIGSATFHGVLLVVIFFGAAFMPKDKLSDMGPVVEFNPGGAPAPKGAAPADPPQPAPATPPQQEKVEPPPPQETIKQPDPVPPKITKREPPKEKEVEKEKGDLPVPVKKETTKKEKDEPKPKSLVNTTVVRRSNVVDQTAMKLAQARRDAALKAERAAQAAAQAAENARRADAINAVNKIVGSAGDGSSNTRVASTVTIGGNGTGAGSGMATGRYGDGLKAIYDSRWVLPTDAYDDEAVAQVRVTVRRDGTVISSAITKPSGNASFDRSVRAVLNNVTRVLPFPPEMKEAERVFTWRFEKRTRLG